MEPTSPMVASISHPHLPSETPEIKAVHYVDGRLTIILQFANDERVTLEFEIVWGFRVLDEGDLLEFWAAEVRTEECLWSVESGGWLDQESLRSGFISGMSPSYREFLVGGHNDCVSVFSGSEPAIRAG
jgi:hypothetical protein